ncbi:NAD(FAD)-utilizing dehydrogenasehypothetical protein [Lachnospiraceae bacterium TWA4]|nr:NAD(FAD)-utilizing dehydrogenasehypothetical protein [Lachnospiraceae bacterium TWA4]
MIQISQLKLPVGHSDEELVQKVVKKLKITRDQIQKLTIRRASIDARKKPELYWVYTIWLELKNEKKFKDLKISPKEYVLPSPGTKELMHRPVIIGTGPAGLFCGLFLARAGYRPILLERGLEVAKRVEKVNTFWETGKLDTNCNVQFGEGGAGTFSDGKLNTLVKDNSGRNHKVLETFVEAGAPTDILYLNKPHIGTDVLREVVQNLHKEIEEAGGEIYFSSQVTDLMIEDDQLKGLEINHKEQIETEVAVLAIGHSARDTFEMLHKRQIPMEAKSFAVGFRIEHPQEMINESQYGAKKVKGLLAADYKLTAKTSTGRGVYSFCMCPGGQVVNSSSEEGHMVVNGMSYRKRDGKNANAALIVTVTPEDYPSNEVLSGVEFQRRIEKAAYEAGNGKIPIQLYGDFKKGQPSTMIGQVHPEVKGQYQLTSLNSILPEELNESLIEGIESFGKKIKGFNREDALLLGVESRTSSPIRILRDDKMQTKVRGIYPCGEGPGYAGGIMSAAMDGIKAAEKIISTFKTTIAK